MKIGVGLIRKECSSPIKYDDDEKNPQISHLVHTTRVLE